MSTWAIRKTYSLDMRPRYEALISARRVYVTPEEAHVVTTRDLPMPPPLVWEWLNDPHKRAQYAHEKVEFVPVVRPFGRTGVGARTHCVHGKRTAMVETVLDWRPFDYFTVEQAMGPFGERATFQLTPIPGGGTRLQLMERGRLTSLGFLDRALITFMLTKLVPTAKLLETLDKCIAADLARQRAPTIE